MKWNKDILKWTREAENYTITDDKIEIITQPIPIYGKEHIIISAMIMPLYCRLKQMKNIFHLQSGQSLTANTVMTNAVL